MVKNYSKNESATVCYDKLCVTAYGQWAKAIKVIALTGAIIWLVQAIKNLN
jgi:hypothetical protein